MEKLQWEDNGSGGNYTELFARTPFGKFFISTAIVDKIKKDDGYYDITKYTVFFYDIFGFSFPNKENIYPISGSDKKYDFDEVEDAKRFIDFQYECLVESFSKPLQFLPWTEMFEKELLAKTCFWNYRLCINEDGKIFWFIENPENFDDCDNNHDCESIEDGKKQIIQHQKEILSRA